MGFTLFGVCGMDLSGSIEWHLNDWHEGNVAGWMDWLSWSVRGTEDIDTSVCVMILMYDW